MSKKSLTSLFAILLITAISIDVNASEKSKTLDDIKIYSGSNELNFQSTQAQNTQKKYTNTESEKKSRDIQIQLALVQKNLDGLKFKQSILENEARLQALKNEYQIQVEYYKISADTIRLETAQSAVKLAEKQLSTEKEKMDRGFSTKLDVDASSNKKNQADNKITDLSRSISEGQNRLKLLINEGKTEEYNITDVKYEIPVNVNITNTYSLQELISACTEKNLELVTYRYEIKLNNTLIQSLLFCAAEEDSAYINAVKELDDINKSIEALTQKIITTSETRYNVFLKCLADQKTGQESKTILEKKLELLESSYKANNISDLQYLSQKISISEEINYINIANADLLNAKSALELITNGIVQ